MTYPQSYIIPNTGTEYIIPQGYFEKFGARNTTPQKFVQGGIIPRQPVGNANWFEVELLRRIGVDPDNIPQGESLALSGYIVYARDENGRKQHEGDSPICEFKEWTDEQQVVIDAMWPYIPDQLKVG